MRRLLFLPVCLGLAAVLPACGPQVAPGRAAYLDFCAGCHGRDGTGSGAMSELAEVGVPDLTRLAAKNGGVFPMAGVLKVMGAGSDPHKGAVAMPDFGNVLGGRPAVWESPEGDVVDTSDTMLMLAEYLASLQT